MYLAPQRQSLKFEVNDGYTQVIGYEKTKPIWTTKEVEGEVSEKSLRNGANHGFLVPAKALPSASGSLALERMQKKTAAAAIGGILPASKKQNGNSGL